MEVCNVVRGFITAERRKILGETPVFSTSSTKLRGHPPEVLTEIHKGDIEMWNPRRIPHLFRRDGQPCSENKDPCLIITKYQGRYAYYCHRCKASGYVYDSELNTPGDAMKFLAHFKGKDKPVVPKLSDMKKLAKRGYTAYISQTNKNLDCLPKDFKFMAAYDVPTEAKDWLCNMKITHGVWQENKIGYSKSWDRIIVPIYSYVRNYNNKIVHRHMNGWVGRCYHELSKKERQDVKRPKYITQKAPGYKHRLFFTAPREFGWDDRSPVVFVEDIFSAIRVNDVMAHECVALLNTHLPYNLVSNYKNNTQILWLDPDMHDVTMKHLKRYQSLGFSIGKIWSEEDPKALCNMEVRRLVNKSVATISRGLHLVDDGQEVKPT